MRNDSASGTTGLFLESEWKSPALRAYEEPGLLDTPLGTAEGAWMVASDGVNGTRGPLDNLVNAYALKNVGSVEYLGED